MYETMVKKAYEEIVGFEKEAAGYAEGVATLGKKLDAAGAQRVRDNVANTFTSGKMRNLAVNYTKADDAVVKADKLQRRIGALAQQPNHVLSKARVALGNAAEPKGFLGLKNRVSAKAANAGLETLSAIRAGRNSSNKNWAAETAARTSKAAAYYDEAQLIKEAAEADYAEACAYEEAAIQILDELGYLD